MNILRSIVYGLWRGLDVLRRFLHLIVLLVVFGFIIGALRGSVPVVPAKLFPVLPVDETPVEGDEDEAAPVLPEFEATKLGDAVELACTRPK